MLVIQDGDNPTAELEGGGEAATWWWGEWRCYSSLKPAQLRLRDPWRAGLQR